jgi:hypothetical protein
VIDLGKRLREATLLHAGPMRERVEAISKDIDQIFFAERGALETAERRVAELERENERLRGAPKGWPEGVEKRVSYERSEDMSVLGKLMVMIDDDGDAIVSVLPDPEGPPHIIASAEFCTGVGGGRSPRTRLALLHLARAIMLDNEAVPDRNRPRPTDGAAD